MSNPGLFFHVILAGLSFSLLAPPGHAATPYEVPKEWTGEWEANGPLPHQALPFRLGRTGVGGARVGSGVMRLESQGKEGGVYWEMDHSKNPELWDGSKPFFIEIRARSVESSDGLDAACHVFLTNGSGMFNFPITNTELQTYRFVSDGSSVRVFVGDKKDPIADEPFIPNTNRKNPSTNSFIFGDATAKLGGVSEWEFVRWHVGS